jgi:rubrerythrin
MAAEPRTEPTEFNRQFAELVYQGLETEIGGVQVYETALKCAVNEDLKEEWTKYLEQTQRHEEIMRDLVADLGLDPEEETPGRAVVRHIGQSLLKAMEIALAAGDPAAAQLVACECVVHAETKDHLNWELLGEGLKTLKGRQREAVKNAHKEVEEQEDEHLYHSKGWCRELWIESLGMPAVLPPPEEEKDVKTAIGAKRAKLAGRESLQGRRVSVRRSSCGRDAQGG